MLSDVRNRLSSTQTEVVSPSYFLSLHWFILPLFSVASSVLGQCSLQDHCKLKDLLKRFLEITKELMSYFYNDFLNVKLKIKFILLRPQMYLIDYNEFI